MRGDKNMISTYNKMLELTGEEIEFLEKIEQRKQKHREAAAKYRRANKDRIRMIITKVTMKIRNQK